MDRCTGVLFYKISEYAGIHSIHLMESLSTTIQNKLKANLSAFQYLLIKKNVASERMSFYCSKAALADTLAKFDT